jgi:homoserine kinase
MAIDIYNIIEAKEIEGSGLDIEVTGEGIGSIPLDESNLVYVSMKTVFDEVGYKHRGISLKLTNGIPLTRGLGSSAACIAGGMAAANVIAGRPLTTKQIINMAARMDGHPDNVLPAIVGGLTVGCMHEEEVFYVRLDPPLNVKFAVLIPDFELETSIARKVLPTHIPVADAVFNIGRAALMIASLMTGEMDNLLVATDDRIHQPYRKGFIPGFDEILSACKKYGARGVFLSGAGPAVIAILNGGYEQFQNDLCGVLSHFKQNWDVRLFDLCRNGIKVESESGRDV